MKIFAIVITYNGQKWYDRCFGSLSASETPVEIVVVDNASSDDTVGFIKERFPGVHLIESKENLGFAKANNIGIRYALDNDADFVFLLNQDAWIEKDTDLPAIWEKRLLRTHICKRQNSTMRDLL